MNTPDTRQWLAFLDDERNSAALYRAVADAEKNPKIAEVYRRLAATEDSHATVWAEKLAAAKIVVPAFKLTTRTRVLITLSKRFGVGAVLPAMSTMESKGTHQYSAQNADTAMIASEQSHARLLSTIRGGLEGGAVAQIEGRHRSAGGNALRAAVLGASDGLLSNMSLVMGVAGAALDNKAILLTGLAGLLAGAFSMSLGEWISVQSSRESYQKQIRTEQEEITTSPDEEAEELSLIYQARGLAEPVARQLAAQIMSNRDEALEALSRDELGVDPKELGGSAWEAAITSFFLFAGGAIVPVFPFIFLAGTSAVMLSLVLSAIGLFFIGSVITLFTGRSIWFSGSRQVLFGLGAAAITFVIGRLLGVSVAG